MLLARVEYGIFGYVLCNSSFSDATVAGLVKKINAKTDELAKNLVEADDEDGDLRRYTPAFANGYCTFGGIMPEFGADDWTGSVSITSSDTGDELEYYHKVCKAVRAGANLQ